MDHSGGILVEQEISSELADIEQATGRLLGTVAGLTEAQARAPSLLPGWTRGHVLTHIARNADGLANLLRWARTGTQTPMYASAEARDADIEAGAGRPAAELAADVRESARAFAAEAGRVPDDNWTVLVTRTPGGEGFPARDALTRRRSELEIHHVDLGAGYLPADWPADFVAETLARVAGALAGRGDVPCCRVWADDGGEAYQLGPAGPAAPVLVSGPATSLLAWLLGRSRGGDLALPAGGELPVLPAWR
ncbi:MAG: maleylpyruvate isomerase family mycothiol-dependent enzyme [Actinobacteria bacterium]|nr:maleylpyruvate isomerase family mycothiol-dependent enzyme [Actinomycetota bacterium]